MAFRAPSPALAFILACCLAGCGGGRAEAPAAARDLEIAAPGGIRLAATLHDPGAPRPPGMLLLHRRGGGRAHWEDFADLAARRGYMSLALDLPGHGGSALAGGRTFRQFETRDWEDALASIEAAQLALLEEGADPENLFVAGEGIGGSLAVLLAQRFPADLHGLVLLSAGLEEQGIRIEQRIRQLPTMPMLFVAAEGDSYAAMSAAALMDTAESFREQRLYAGAAHGADLLAANAQAAPQILDWLDLLREKENNKND